MILADPCMFEATARLLKTAGFVVTRLREFAPVNSADSDVVALAVERDEILLTNETTRISVTSCGIRRTITAA